MAQTTVFLGLFVLIVATPLIRTVAAKWRTSSVGYGSGGYGAVGDGW